MRKVIGFTFCFVLIIVFLNFTENVFASEYYVINLHKTFQTKNLIPEDKNVELNVFIKQDVCCKKEILRKTLEISEQFEYVAKQYGWQFSKNRNWFDFKTEIEVVIVPRMNMNFKNTLVIKSYIYSPGEGSSMRKYRGGSMVKYWEKVLKKTEYFIRRNIN